MLFRSAGWDAWRRKERGRVQLLAGRECGECQVCCDLLNIDSPEFQKMPQTPCAHLAGGGKGCAIHTTRYPACRAYHCAWRYMANFSEDWRPDRSGVLIDFQNDGIPAQYSKRPGLRFTIAGPRETVHQPGFVNALTRLLGAGIPVVLAFPGPPGHYPAFVLLNEMLAGATPFEDSSRIGNVLRDLVEGLEGHVFSPVVHANKGASRP